MPLQHIYRPNTIEDIYGNDALKESLKSVLSRKEDIPHSFLFTGPSGSGKTTVARIIANMLGCSRHSFYEYDAADDRGIDSIRAMKQNIKYMPMIGDVTVVLLDEFHEVTHSAAEALLKTLEEPPAHAYIILCTTDPQKIKVTIKRRCHQYEMKALNNGTTLKLLKDILSKEGINDFPVLLLDRIVTVAKGSAGQALKILDEIIDVEDDEKAIQIIEGSGMEDSPVVIELCRSFLKVGDNWSEISNILKDIDTQPETLRRAILGYYSKMLLAGRDSERVSDIMTIFSENLFDTGKPGIILQAYYANKC